MEIKLEDYKTIIVDKKKYVLPKRIEQYIILSENVIAISVYSRKMDVEYGVKLDGGYLFFIKDEQLLQFNVTISNMWKKDNNTLGIYDGVETLYLDINKMEIIRSIWNPWGLDNPEKYK
jgi:hypothetical protein